MTYCNKSIPEPYCKDKTCKICKRAKKRDAQWVGLEITNAQDGDATADHCSCGREWRYGEPRVYLAFDNEAEDGGEGMLLLTRYKCAVIRFCPSCGVYEEMELKQKTV